MSRLLFLCVALTACDAAENRRGVAPVAMPGVARAAPAPSGACSAADLETLVNTLREASGAVRLNLMVAGLKTACPTMEPGLLAWIAAQDDAGSPPEATALRTTRCPDGDDLWGAPVADWGAWSIAVWEQCALEGQSVVSRTELAGGAGPEAGLLGIALHDHLQSTHAEHARTLGRWVAGHPPDPGVHLSRRRYGAFGQSAPVALLGSTASRPPDTRCMPVLSLTPDALTVDHAPHSLETLAAALAPCRAQASFRGELLVAVQPDTLAVRLVETLQAAGTEKYATASLLVRSGDPEGEAVVPAHDALVAVRQVTWTTVPLAASSSTGGASETVAKSKSSSKASKSGATSKSGGKSSKSGASTFPGGGVIGGGSGSGAPTPRILLTASGFEVTKGATSGVATSGSMAELAAVLGGLDKPGEVLEVGVSEEVSVAALMAVLEAAQGTHSASGKPTGPFPFVQLGRVKP